ncbi:polyphosphate kinase 2 family protein [Nocardioides marmoriginsengisoli]|uniref:Polyphosphate kinase 2 family protein n=1 Tax=Nocardioides marmoriginsengisoli TaxID=661483 RepID=A0A3N0CL40_9ACTN|nr:polyphosphate kinase 2 family protein [Nocardioides marmoriginsengisoli]RNL64177.1 polyphosphate kinase 2 family protein [Nocardioides marmoriginsengisoli]
MISELLRVPAGPVDLAAFDTGGKPGFDGDKAAGEEALPALGAELADLQEKLFARGYTGGSGRVLLVLQGMDTSGKGGVLSHTVGLLNPSGLRLKSFKKPTKEELSHDFLWRIERELPATGEIGIFDRSHYEDVLVVKVHELADAAEVERRYDAINDFEAKLAAEGTTIIKCMLHVSREEQKQRLLARLDDPTKQWKFKPGDIDERGYWDAYQEAYEIALSRCNTEVAPWHVIPSDRKWYRNLAIGNLLLEALRGLDLDWPAPDYDVAEQRARLVNEGTP